MRGIVNYARHRTKNMRIIRLSYMNTTAIAIYLSSQKHLRQRSNLVHKKKQTIGIYFNHEHLQGQDVFNQVNKIFRSINSEVTYFDITIKAYLICVYICFNRI